MSYDGKNLGQVGELWTWSVTPTAIPVGNFQLYDNGRLYLKTVRDWDTGAINAASSMWVGLSANASDGLALAVNFGNGTVSALAINYAP
jgi:hypothetical protein